MDEIKITNRKTIKVIHCADVHLDSPFSDSDPEKAAVLRSELRGAFSSLITYARFNDVDIVLMAGDIFDCDFATRETVALMMRLFEENKKCRFVISPGNHDPYTRESIWSRVHFPDNVYIFDKEELAYFSFEDINTEVYGYAFCGVHMEKNPFSGQKPQNKDKINILCAHGDMFDMLSRKCPIRESDITESGFDYVALGHIHSSKNAEHKNGVWFAYSGCLSGRDFGECGHKGALILEISKSDNKTEADINIKKHSFSKRRYEKSTINIEGILTEEELYNKITGEISKNYGKDTSLRIILTGNVPPELKIFNSGIAEHCGSNLFSLEIKNNTVPFYKTERLLEDNTIRGEFFRTLLPDLTEGNEEEREIAAMALRFGLSVIDGSDITI